jgi:hypothetical protein
VTKVGRPRFIAGVNDLPQLLDAWHPAVQSSLAVTPTAWNDQLNDAAQRQDTHS